MKKFYLLALSIFLTGAAHAQNYYPMLDSVANVWTFIGNVIPVRLQQNAISCDYNSFTFTSSEIYTVNDTLIGNETYKVLYLQDLNSGQPDCHYGYIREDTAAKKIYFIDYLLSPPVLLYDFSMQVGDSINLDFISPWGSYFQDGYYHLDSVANINIHAGVRRIFYLSIPGVFTPYPLEWIESVGHPGHLVYPYSLNMSAGSLFWCNDPIQRDFYHLLTCFEHTSSKVYFDSCSHSFAFNNWCFNYVDSCNYWNICGSIEEYSLLTSFEITPNPSAGPVTLNLEAMREGEARLELIEMSGKKILTSNLLVKEGKNQLVLDTGLPAGGSYLLLLHFGEGTVFRHLIRTPQ